MRHITRGRFRNSDGPEVEVIQSHGGPQ